MNLFCPLKAYSLPRTCTICMERFHDDDNSDVKVSTMPCGHIFHYNCILQWLQKGHVYPLCR
ncbi:zinc finger, C3HC4 type (RING finger) protein [Medicago truncatula]|uniref:Zinc finger, C3HC4 type (RING finger) protein n=1 Tax=Medicago truncatula TaxID=3880 RepID=G8A169_MEDTR|nr:zinc finger, C3HC4 type (RING finger) protein [Medicago truncatula]